MRRVFVGIAVLGGCAVLTARAWTEDPPVLSSVAVTWEEIEAKRAPGGRASQVFRHPTATLDELELHVTTLPAGVSSHPPHKHPDEEVIIIRQGTVETMVNGQTRVVGPGSVIFQASNQMHSLKNVGETPAAYHVIKWNSPGMLKKKTASLP